MEMILTDDIGDTKVFSNGDLHRVLIYGHDLKVNSHFYPCECGNIVLYPIQDGDDYMCRNCAEHKNL